MREDLPDHVGNEVLSTAEMRSAISALTPADEARLLKAADKLAEINGFDDHRGLLQEALVRAMAGTRCCPRNVPPVPFLFHAMRSIANSVSKSAKRSPIDRFAELDDAEEQDEGVEAAQHVTPEREVAARDTLQKLNEQFKGDEEVLLVLYAMADGLQGKELRDELGLTETEHNTIRRRMMRQSKSLAEAWRQK